jgi:hypothetical protein
MCLFWRVVAVAQHSNSRDSDTGGLVRVLEGWESTRYLEYNFRGRLNTSPTALVVYDRLIVANLRLLFVTNSSKFERILVLNLPSRTDRRDAMSLSAAISNIKLEFVEGVKGADINDKAYPPPEENRKHSPGIRGSWRTHMNALQRYQAQSRPLISTINSPCAGLSIKT